MSPGVIIAIVVGVAVIVAAGVWFYIRRRRSKVLREHIGQEYDPSVQEQGDRSAAEPAVQERQAQVEQLDIHPLSTQQTARFSESWREAQARFVDDPVAAIKEADRLVQDVMGARGYPGGDFEARASLISDNHQQVVSNYRAAHELAQRNTEDLRRAIVHYRTLFEELLVTQVVPGTRVDAEPAKASQPRPQGETLVPNARLVAPMAPAGRAGRYESTGRYQSTERKAA